MTTTRAAALYIGALLGPSLLLLPGLAAAIAGPASIIDWLALLILSGLFAWVFAALGRRFRSRGGVATYVAAGLGERAGRAVAWSFLAGVVFGAPVVCLVGGAYVAHLAGGGRGLTVGLAGALLAVVVVLTLGGTRTSSTAQLALVLVLVVLVVVAVAGSAHALDAANWQPFAPHGSRSIGHAASVLMLSFVGWEAVAPMTAQLRDPDRQLPRVIVIAFTVTATLYLGLAVATIGVLGGGAGSAVPLADLLEVAVGPVGRAVAAVAAISLTVGGVNAYLSGAAELAAEMTGRESDHRLHLAVAGLGALTLAGVGAGLLTTTQLVSIPTTLFLVVYLGCTASAARILHGGVRVAAAVSCVAVLVVLTFSGWALVVAAVLVAASLLSPARRRAHGRARALPAVRRQRGVAAAPSPRSVRPACSS